MLPQLVATHAWPREQLPLLTTGTAAVLVNPSQSRWVRPQSCAAYLRLPVKLIIIIKLPDQAIATTPSACEADKDVSHM
jgi:hypothetical protein